MSDPKEKVLGCLICGRENVTGLYEKNDLFIGDLEVALFPLGYKEDAIIPCQRCAYFIQKTLNQLRARELF